MKQLFVIGFLAIALVSCNNADTTKTSTEEKSGAEVKLPYELAKPYKNWQIGSNENVVAAMTGLKAFVDKDFATLASLLGDSVELSFDGYHEKLHRDSAMKVFTAQRALSTDITITMYDYVSVISADKKDEWVTTWYKQTWKNEKGVVDSVSVIDDCKMEKGKLIQLDEKVQRFPAKK